MKFAIDAVVLYLTRQNDKLERRINFKRNGVNVITGQSGTGKTAFIDIIDYCFLASSHKISDSVINENVSWYALELYIDGTKFFLARRAPVGNIVSEEYFFTQSAEHPFNFEANIVESDLRNIFEALFKIDSRAVVAYGGKKLKAGSKISFRYFFLFNTISQDIITNSEFFFDKQNNEKYREALPRLFDLALGIDDIENISAREKKEDLIRELNQLQRKTKHIKEKYDLFGAETRETASRAISYGLMEAKKETATTSDIMAMIKDAYTATDPVWTQRYNQISGEIFGLKKRIRMLEKFSQETKNYKETLNSLEDSLFPLVRLLERTDEVVKTEHFDSLISGLKTDLLKVKTEIARKKPIDSQVAEVVKNLKAEKDILTIQLEAVPPNPIALQSEREKWLFIGETKGRLDIFTAAPNTTQGQKRTIADIESDIATLTVRNVENERDNVIRAIEDVALDLKNQIKAVLENYAEYVPIFNFKEKKLEMRKPRSSLIENVGSSSNHMFMHLLHFLALHEVAIGNKSPYVPSFILIDQPSRPYYGDEEQAGTVEALPKTDTGKITAAFKLLNDFIESINFNYKVDFQMIVFEHIPPSIFKAMPHVHLIERFRDGVALIPESWKSVPR